MSNDWCAYCGDYNQCRDHVRPISYDSVFRHYNESVNIVPCCLECNTLAGDVFVTDISEKAFYLERQYISKYGTPNKTFVWSDKELDELDCTLRSFIQNQEYSRRLLIWKIENLERVQQGFNSISIWTPTEDEIKQEREKLILCCS